MKKYYWYAGLLNFFSGFPLFIIVFLWFMCFIYIAEATGWIMDPTLDEGLLPVFLFLATTASLVFFPVLILANRKFRKKMILSKIHFGIFAGAFLIFGWASFFGILYFL